jgi:hypothetical protein
MDDTHAMCGVQAKQRLLENRDRLPATAAAGAGFLRNSRKSSASTTTPAPTKTIGLSDGIIFDVVMVAARRAALAPCCLRA